MVLMSETNPKPKEFGWVLAHPDSKKPGVYCAGLFVCLKGIGLAEFELYRPETVGFVAAAIQGPAAVFFAEQAEAFLHVFFINHINNEQNDASLAPTLKDTGISALPRTAYGILGSSG